MIRGRKQCDPISGCGTFYKQHLDACPSCDASEAFSSIVPFNPLDWTYDLETYPNLFTAAFKHVNTGHRVMFEISEWRNDLDALFVFLQGLKQAGCRLVGFNNIGFDYPIIHFIIDHYHLSPTVHDIYNKAASIISTPWANRFDNVIWDSDVHIQQIDLYKIHHFDNEARRTSLKMLEFNMRSERIEDLPFEPGTVLTFEQSREVVSYNWDDVDETEKFYIESIEMIEFREQLSDKFNQNFLNYSDKKIGTAIFVNKLEASAPGICYTRDHNNRRVPRQTIRQSIALKDVIFPYIKFKEPEFERVKNWLAAQVITETKGVFKDVSATVNGFKYDFGTGGIHGSISSSIVCSDDDGELWDWDVGGYYPTLGSVNKLYPEHLSEQFGVVDNELALERKQYKKGTALNNSIKLARNGAYGDSNNKYSVFYDPKYTMSITINGQLLLCMLAQYLNDIPGLQMIQINTDGLTVKCPRPHIETMKKICKWWESYTCLELESVIYKRMFIRDVNNYIGEYENGKLKSKGAYVHKTKLSQGPTWTPSDMDWHQNQSALVVPKAAEAALVHGKNIREFIINHNDIFDFMLRTKISRADKLIISDASGNSRELQKITRYYVSTDGGALTKISPPTKGYQVGQWKRKNSLSNEFYNAVIAELRETIHDIPLNQSWELDSIGVQWDERINTGNRSKYEERRTGINAGQLVTPCNNINDASRDNINFDYYIAEAEKLVKPLRGLK